MTYSNASGDAEDTRSVSWFELSIKKTTLESTNAFEVLASVTVIVS